jgi:hypothetical protein
LDTNQLVALETTGVSRDTRRKVADSRKTSRCFGNNRRVQGYEKESCRLLDNIPLLWNSQACPWIGGGKLQTLGKYLVAVESTGVTMDTRRIFANSWKISRCCGIHRHVHGYEQAKNVSSDTATLYEHSKRPTR